MIPTVRSSSYCTRIEILDIKFQKKRKGLFGNVEVVERLGGLKEPVKPFELINGVGKG